MIRSKRSDSRLSTDLTCAVMPTYSLDLWTPQVPTVDQHPHFRGLRNETATRGCLDRWTDGFVDIDNDFVPKFQRSFSPQFWELYLHAMFKSLGFKPTRPKAHPDFLLNAPQGVIVAEAKVTEAGPGQTPEWTNKSQVPFDADQYREMATSKLSGAVKGKINSYRKYSAEPHVKDRPFLLCLAPFDHPWFIVQHARSMWRVLYQYDQPMFHVSDSGNMIETGHKRVESFTTHSGSQVPLGYFLDPANADVSAVFFNPRATLSKIFSDPLREHHKEERVFASWYMVSTGMFARQDVHPSNYRETLADGGYLLQNPYATKPIEPEPFFNQGVTVFSFDPTARRMTARTPEPFLFERTTCNERKY